MTIAPGQVARAADVAVLAGILPGTCVARLRRSSTSTITQGTAIPWDAEDWDTLDGHSTTSNTTRYTPTVAGRYLVIAVLRHQAIAANSAVIAAIAKNGSPTVSATASANSSGSAGTGITVSDVIACNGTTDYIECTIGNNQATAVNCSDSVVIIIYAGEG